MHKHETLGRAGRGRDCTRRTGLAAQLGGPHAVARLGQREGCGAGAASGRGGQRKRRCEGWRWRADGNGRRWEQKELATTPSVRCSHLPTELGVLLARRAAGVQAATPHGAWRCSAHTPDPFSARDGKVLSIRAGKRTRDTTRAASRPAVLAGHAEW